MAFKCEQAFSRAHVPDFRRVIEGGSHEFIAVGVEMQTDDLSFMAAEVKNFLARFHVPQLRCVVHGSSGYKHSVRIERQAHDLHFVTFQSMVPLAGIGIPDLCLSVKEPVTILSP